MALAAFRRAVRVAHESLNWTWEGLNTRDMAILEATLGVPGKALASLSRCLESFSRPELRTHEGVALGGVAVLFDRIGRLEAAATVYGACRDDPTAELPVSYLATETQARPGSSALTREDVPKLGSPRETELPAAKRIDRLSATVATSRPPPSYVLSAQSTRSARPSASPRYRFSAIHPCISNLTVRPGFAYRDRCRRGLRVASVVPRWPSPQRGGTAA